MNTFKLPLYTVEAIPEGIREKQSLILKALMKVRYDNHELECMRVILLEEFKLVEELQTDLKDYREFIENSRPKHRECEDSYYNCDKLSYDGEIYDDEECSCGADETNQEIDKLLKGGKG